MAISNYTELKTAVQSWLHRPDLDCADFVRMGEAFLNRRLELSPMLATDVTIITQGTVKATYLANVTKVVSVTLDGKPLTPARLIGRQSEEQGEPEFYEAADAIYLDRPADRTYDFVITYLKAWDIAADTYNRLLTIAPDAYLYASLVAATPYVIDERLATFKPMLDEVVNDLNRRYPAIGKNPRILNTEVSGMTYAA